MFQTHGRTQSTNVLMNCRQKLCRFDIAPLFRNKRIPQSYGFMSGVAVIAVMVADAAASRTNAHRSPESCIICSETIHSTDEHTHTDTLTRIY